MRCFGCGVDKDLTKEEVYPYDNDRIDNTEPGLSLLTIECEPSDDGKFRMLVLCFDCWHRLEGDNGPDMWTAQQFYEELNPVVPFDRLPFVRYVPDYPNQPELTGEKVYEDIRRCQWHPRSYNTVDWSGLEVRR